MLSLRLFNNNKFVSDKAILITGCSSGIGYATSVFWRRKVLQYLQLVGKNL